MQANKNITISYLRSISIDVVMIISSTTYTLRG